MIKWTPEMTDLTGYFHILFLTPPNTEYEKGPIFLFGSNEFTNEKGYKLATEYNALNVNGDIIGNYYTAESLFEREYLFCKDCGRPEINHWNNWDELKEKQLCFHCYHWHGVLSAEYRFITNGEHYIGHMKDRGFQGHSGRLFIIALHDKGVVVCNNLWHQGDIPKRFRERDEYKDNCQFLPVFDDELKAKAKWIDGSPYVEKGDRYVILSKLNEENYK